MADTLFTDSSPIVFYSQWEFYKCIIHLICNTPRVFKYFVPAYFQNKLMNKKRWVLF